MMKPSLNKKLVDVACGTGDIGKLYLDNTSKNEKITCIDPNEGMINQGKQKLSNYNNIEWIISSAEKLPLPDNTFDFYTISFGLRNTKNLDKALETAMSSPRLDRVERRDARKLLRLYEAKMEADKEM